MIPSDQTKSSLPSAQDFQRRLQKALIELEKHKVPGACVKTGRPCGLFGHVHMWVDFVYIVEQDEKNSLNHWLSLRPFISTLGFPVFSRNDPLRPSKRRRKQRKLKSEDAGRRVWSGGARAELGRMERDRAELGHEGQEPLVASLLLVAMPGAPSSFLVPSSKARSPQ